MGKPAARVGDHHICPKSDGPKAHVGGPIAEGSPNVFINGKAAARQGDKATCIGDPDTISEGSTTVFINGKPAATLGNGSAHKGQVVIGSANVHIGDGKGTATVTPSPNLDHIVPPTDFADARQRLDKAQDALETARANGEPLPPSQYSTADKMALVDQGLEEPIIARIVESKYATDDHNLGPNNKKATYWTTTFTQVEHCDHDAKLICEAVGKPYDPDSEYKLLLIDQQAASEELEMVSFIPTTDAMVAWMEETAADDEDLAPLKDDIGPAMTPTYAHYYEHFRREAKKRGYKLGEEKDQLELAQELGFDETQSHLLGVRYAIEKKFGANEQFLGNGLANDSAAGNPRTPFGPVQKDMSYGVAEVMTYDKNPQSQRALMESNMLDRVDLK